MATTRKQDQSFASDMIDHVQVTEKALNTAIEWMQKNFDPDDVFGHDQLSAWAEANGYKKEDSSSFDGI